MFAVNPEEAIRRAADAVHAADTLAEFRKEAFSEVLHFLLRHDNPSRSPNPTEDSTDGAVATESSPNSPMEQLATRLNIPIDLAEQAFYLDREILEITIPSGKIAASKKTGSRQVCLLLAAGRQATGLDQEWTHSGLLREACSRFGRFDQNNFGSTLSSMDDVFHIRGRQQEKEVRVLVPGFEDAGELVRRLLGME